MNSLKKLIFVDDEQHCEELYRILDGKYDMTIVEDMQTAEGILRSSKANVSALLINANRQDDIWDAIEYVKNSNKLISIPILIYADEDTPEDSFACLGSGVVDCICKPYVSKIVKNRIANAITLTDSMSFYGIEELLKHLPSNIFLKDDECRYVFATKYWHHLKKPDDDPDWTIRGLTDPEVRKDKENAIMAHKKDMEIIETGEGATYSIEINEDGIQEFFQVIKQPLINEEGFVTGIVGLINDITDYELLKKKLREQAITDELTGLYNRVYLEEFINTHGDEYYPLGIISADCDGLKEINDTYGHTAGDEYIQAAVSLFRQVLPKESIVFRMGGDEFLILLPTTTEKALQHIAKQLRDTEKMFRVMNKELSVSLGVSVMDSRKDGFDASLAESDRNMYSEKKEKKSSRK